MKKVFTLALVLVFALTVSAQKGSFYLGTSGMSPLGFQSITENGVNFTMSPVTGFSILDSDGGASQTVWGLAPEVGYFVSDNIAVGLGIYYTSSAFDSGVSSAETITLNTFGVNPYARYYFLNKGAFRMYGQADFAYASGKFDAKGSESIDYFSVGIKPGVSYSFSDRFGINATFGSLGYEDVKDAYSKLGLTLDMSSLKFGFTVSF